MAALLDLDLFQRLWLADALFWKLLLPVFLSITPTLIFSANESLVWSLNYCCDHRWWNWERIWYFSCIFAAHQSLKQCFLWEMCCSQSCPAATCFKNSCWEEHCKLLCLAYLTLPCRLTMSSTSGLVHFWEKDTQKLATHSGSDLGSQAIPEGK